MATAEELLAAQLTKANERIEELEDEVGTLERRLDEDDGWRRNRDLPEDSLPIPRLELVYTPDEERGWADYEVIYRLVLRHLVGHMYAIPIGRTMIQGGSTRDPHLEPGVKELPFRDGSHIAHDSFLLSIPAYKVMPNREPYRLNFEDYQHATERGKGHRRL